MRAFISQCIALCVQSKTAVCCSNAACDFPTSYRSEHSQVLSTLQVAMPAVAATTTKLSALVEAARSVQVRGRAGTTCTGLACFLACRPWMTLARMRARDARSMDDTLRRDLKLASLLASAT